MLASLFCCVLAHLQPELLKCYQRHQKMSRRSGENFKLQTHKFVLLTIILLFSRRFAHLFKQISFGQCF